MSVDNRLRNLWQEVQGQPYQQNNTTRDLKAPSADLSEQGEIGVFENQPTPEQEKHRADERKYWQRDLRLTKWQNWITGIAAIVGVFVGLLNLWLIWGTLKVTKTAADAAWTQAQTSQGQLEEMRSSSADTKAVADAAKAQAANTEKLAIAAERQSRAMKDMAEAATSSAKIADQTLTLTRRPWVAVEHQIIPPLTFQRMEGDTLLAVDEVLKNNGQSTAVDIISWAGLVPEVPLGGFKNALAKQRQHCDMLRRPKRPYSLGYEGFTLVPKGLALIPGKEYRLPKSDVGRLLIAPVKAVRKAVSQAASELGPRFAGQIQIVVVGCISYRALFEAPDTPRHQTRFMYTVGNGIISALDVFRPLPEWNDPKWKDFILQPIGVGTSAD